MCICAHPLLGMENFCGYVDCGAEVLAKTKINGFEVEREGVVLTLLLHLNNKYGDSIARGIHLQS